MNNVVIGNGTMEGKGVYADRDFKQGEIVIQYHLKELSQDEYKNLSTTEKEFTHSHHGRIYLYSIPERYVNHSFRPNTMQDFTRNCDVAKRGIKKGEQITTDASMDDI